MKYLTLKLTAIVGLLVTGSSFSQSALEDEMLLQPGETLPNMSWQGEFNDSIDDLDYIQNKTYGVAPSGIYSIYLTASSATNISKNGFSRYASGGCIYRHNTSSAAEYASDMHLQLPDGHELRGFRYYFDDKNTSSSRATLYTVSNTGTFSNLVQITSTGDTGYNSIYDTVTTPHFVDNTNLRYGIRFSSSEKGTNQKMCGARVALRSGP